MKRSPSWRLLALALVLPQAMPLPATGEPTEPVDLHGRADLTAHTGLPAPGELHAAYDSLLGRYVAESGVRYAAWSTSETDHFVLKSYIERLETIDPNTLSRAEALAFWINLYNAVTLDLILDHYPIPSIRSFGSGAASAWDRKLVTVAGRSLTLNEIENDIVRAGFEDPRVHFALNCAARSCPSLAATAFVGEELEAQLEAVTAAALHDPAFVDLSGCRTGEGTIRLNMIFDWYASDWTRGNENVRAFIARYHPRHRELLLDERCLLDYNDYDWALNEALDP